MKVLFNPYTGEPRNPLDIESDPQGLLIWDKDKPLRPAITSREDAIALARRVLFSTPAPLRPSYYSEPFVPHDWVIESILAASKSLDRPAVAVQLTAPSPIYHSVLAALYDRDDFVAVYIGTSLEAADTAKQYWDKNSHGSHIQSTSLEGLIDSLLQVRLGKLYSVLMALEKQQHSSRGPLTPEERTRITQYVAEKVGAASMCWEPRPSKEVFNSEEAIKILNNITDYVFGFFPH